jgi:hypothetical protein
MKNTLMLAAVIAAFLLPTSADAQWLCRYATTCDSALNTCIAWRNMGLPPDAPESDRVRVSRVGTCEASAAECRRTGIWHGMVRGVGPVGQPFWCMMPR